MKITCSDDTTSNRSIDEDNLVGNTVLLNIKSNSTSCDVHESNVGSTTSLDNLCMDPCNNAKYSNNNTTKQHDHKKDISDDDSSDDENRK